MPIYEYICMDCGSQFDELRPMAQADDVISCHQCQGDHTSRKISLFSAHSDGKVLTSGSTNCSACSTFNCSSCSSPN